MNGERPCGIVWPNFPEGTHRAQILALLDQLEQTQWWDQERIVEHQLAQLRKLLAYFWRTSPFCRARWEALGDPDTGLLGMERFRTVPVLRREDLQVARAELTSAQPPPGHGHPIQDSSSGSTGKPVKTIKSIVNVLMHRALSTRNHQWHRRDFSLTLAHMQGFAKGYAMPPGGLRATGWSPAIDTGPCVALNTAHSTLAQQVAFLCRTAPAYVLSYPTNLHALAVWCEQRGIRLPSLQGILTFSEALSPGQREVIEAVFGVQIQDLYSASEVSTIALQCPNNPNVYHVQSENVLVEIVDDDDVPVGPHERGRVLVTSLHNFYMPLVRYDIGDLARWGKPCPCGRGLPVIERIFGRVRSMLRLPNGEQIFPDIAALKLHEIAPLRQYQMVQTSYDEIEVKMALTRPLTATERAKLRQLILAALGLPLELRLTRVEDIPRHPSGKFEDFVCAVEDESPAPR